MKKRRFDEGGEIDRKRFAAGITVDKDYPDDKEKSSPKATKKKVDETESGPQEDTSAVSGMASRKYKNMPSDERKEESAKNIRELAEDALTILPAGRAAMAVGRVGEAATVAGRTYAERQRFLKQAEKEYNQIKDDLAKGNTPTQHSNIFGKRGISGQEATNSAVTRLREKGYAKGGSIRGGGIESRGKTKGRFV